MKYNQMLETSYNDTIKDLKVRIELEKAKIRKINFEKAANVSHKNDLESIFVECIEEVRKDIMKRRLKSEIHNKKKF